MESPFWKQKGLFFALNQRGKILYFGSIVVFKMAKSISPFNLIGAFSFLFLFASMGLYAQDLQLTISQHNLPYGNKFEYTIDDKLIKVTCTGDYCEEANLKFEIAESDIQKVVTTLAQINFSNLDSLYHIPFIDGTYWHFQTNEKSIAVENCFVAELDKLLDTINAILPETHHWISLKNAPRKN